MEAKTILIVEDNFDNREIYKVILERAGYRVLEAYDGANGVSLARECLPDLILMDISMPVLDGWGALTALRADTRTDSIPVLALSAHVLVSDDRRRATEAGFAAYLTKPIEPKQVLQEVRRTLEAGMTGSKAH